MRWFELDLQAHCPLGQCVGLRIARIMDHDHHELVLLLERKGQTARATAEAHTERVALEHLDMHLTTSKLTLSRLTPVPSFSLTVYAQTSVVRGEAGEGAVALRSFAETLEALKGSSKQTRATEAPTFHEIAREHEAAIRARPAPRRAMQLPVKAHQAKSNLHSAGRSPARQTERPISAENFYRKQPSVYWGNSKSAGGLRQAIAAQATESAPVPLGAHAQHRSPGAVAATAAVPAPTAFTLASRSAGSQPPPRPALGFGARERAMYGDSPGGTSARAGPRFGDDVDDDDEPRASGRPADRGGGRPLKQPRLAPVAPALSYGALAKRGGTTSHAAEARSSGGGFRNIGNTCYMSSVLSALLGLSPFVEDVMASIPLFSPRLDQSSLFSALASLMHQRFAQGDERPATPRRLKDAIARRSAQFAGSSQQDAHEFLADCLDGLQEEMSEALRAEITPPLPSHPMPATAAAAATATATRMPIELPSEAELPCALNFTIEVEHTLTCAKCAHSWTRGEIMRHFSLDLPTASVRQPPVAGGTPASIPNLQSLLAAFFEDSHVEVACEQCDGQSASVHHRISKLPRVLTLHLKRFDSTATGVRKRLDPVRPSHTLQLRSCCKPNAQPPPALRARAAVVKPLAAVHAAPAPERAHRPPAPKLADLEPSARAADTPGSKAPRRSLFTADPDSQHDEISGALGGAPDENMDAQRPGGQPAAAAGARSRGLHLVETARPVDRAGSAMTHAPQRPPLGGASYGGAGGRDWSTRDTAGSQRQPRLHRDEQSQLDAAIAASLESARRDESRRQQGGPEQRRDGRQGGQARSSGANRISQLYENLGDEEAQLRLAMEMSLADAQAASARDDASAQPIPQPSAVLQSVDLTSPEVPQEPATGGKAALPIVLDVDDDDEQFEAAMMEAVDVAEAQAVTAAACAVAAEEEEAQAELSEEEVGTSYQLCATVWHAGTTASSGHYIADVRKEDKGGGRPGWQRFDDSFVSSIPSNTPDATTKGYVFFYVHSGSL